MPVITMKMAAQQYYVPVYTNTNNLTTYESPQSMIPIYNSSVTPHNEFEEIYPMNFSQNNSLYTSQYVPETNSTSIGVSNMKQSGDQNLPVSSDDQPSEQSVDTSCVCFQIFI